MPSNSRKLEVTITSSSKDFDRGFQKAGRSAKSFGQQIDQANQSGVRKLNSNLDVAKQRLIGLRNVFIGGFAAKQAFDATIGAFASFDDKLNQSLAIMGNVSDAMRQDLANAARDVAKNTLISADQAAEAYYFLASAGLSAQQSIAALPAVAQFAQAGMFDMATATDLATDAQSALGLKADDATQNLTNLTRVTDVLVDANKLANGSVQQFSEALTNKAGAALRAVGKDVEEGVAVLADFADQGIKGAEAGQQLNIVLRDLQTKALQNQDAFRQAGVSVFDASGNMRNLADVISDLEGRLSGVSDAEKKTVLLGLGFSDKSVSAIQALLGTSDAIRRYESELRQAGGTTKEVADKQLESATAKWNLFLSKIKDIGIGIGEDLTPALVDMLPSLESSAEGFASMADSITSIIKVAKPVTDVFGNITKLLNTSPREGGGLLGFFGDFLNPLNLYRDFNDQFNETLIALGLVPSEAEKASRATSVQTEAVKRATSGYGELGDKVGSADDALRNVASRGSGAAGAIEQINQASETATPTLQDLADALAAVSSRQLELASPAFAAAQAQKRLADAQENYKKVSKDSESTDQDIAQAKLDVANAALEADAAVTEFGSSKKEQGIQAIADALGDTYSNAEDLLTTIGVLDENGDIVLNVSLSMSDADRALLNSVATATTGGGHKRLPQDRGFHVAGARASGGPTDPWQAYTVGERGPETLVMGARSGYVLPSGESGGGTTISIPISIDARGATGKDANRIGREVTRQLSRELRIYQAGQNRRI